MGHDMTGGLGAGVLTLPGDQRLGPDRTWGPRLGTGHDLGSQPDTVSLAGGTDMTR